MSKKASEQLQGYDWPGNVRELEHVLSRGALKAIREQGRDSKIISIEAPHLDLQISTSLTSYSQSIPANNEVEGVVISGSTVDFRASVDHYQRGLIEQQLALYKNNIAATARALSLDRSNLVRTMKRLGL